MWPRILPLLLLPLLGCPGGPPRETVTASSRVTNFTISLADDDAARALLASGAIRGADCSLDLATVAGRPALRIATVAEFCDAWIDLERVVDRPIDFGNGGVLSFDLLIPEESQIVSVKFNHAAADGSVGGCGNYFNNVHGNRGEWLRVTVPLQEQYEQCQNWVGEGDILRPTYVLSVNPYNAERSDTSVLYINNISLGTGYGYGGPGIQRLAPRPRVTAVNPYTITFDDDTLLARQLAYRTFESTTQSLAKNKFGNPSRAIRAYGTGANNYICWLPDIAEMTGQPVNFHRVDSLFFRYYLTPESDTIAGARLFFTTGEDWQGLLIAEDFMQPGEFVRGQWTRHAVAIDDLDLTPAREFRDVLAAVYELRLDLKYAKSAEPIEIWYDDFGWK